MYKYDKKIKQEAINELMLSIFSSIKYKNINGKEALEMIRNDLDDLGNEFDNEPIIVSNYNQLSCGHWITKGDFIFYTMDLLQKKKQIKSELLYFCPNRTFTLSPVVDEKGNICLNIIVK